MGGPALSASSADDPVADPAADPVADEQAVLDRAHQRLAAMRDHAALVLAESKAAGGLELDHKVALVRRVNLLADSSRPLCFGRVDEAGLRGETWHIGRRHVEDERGDPLVLEWRVPVAAAFYRAGVDDPMGLHRRRQILVEDRRVLSVADDLFDESARAAGSGPRLRGGDALLAELERARTGEMLDIVATIQAEQDVVIRAPLPGVIAVQGGPGTGKTAIGLHRVAYLLYNHPELARAGVLVVGPSRTFLRYIGQVLPSLGEEAVTQVTLADLVPKVRVRSNDTEQAATLKGDPRMATVLARALAGYRRPVEEDAVVPTGLSRLRLPADEINRIAATLAGRDGPYLAGRAALRQRIAGLATRIRGADVPGVATTTEVKAALDRAWPSVPATAVVADLLASPDRLARAAAGVLGDGEQRALLRPAAPTAGRIPWTAGDVALVDEATALLKGLGRTYGHVVLDEAQDLTPMQLRMIARRAPAGSVTVLGDLAQASGPWAHDRWADVVAVLPTPDGWRQEELTVGYRTTGHVLDLASRLLPVAAPGVAKTTSVRPGTRPPRVIHAGPDDLYRRAAEEARALTGEGFGVGLIVADAALDRARAGLRLARVAFWLADQDGLSQPVTLLGASAAKGLEFDAVVVVEPAEIAGRSPRGHRLLYVALTRPIQHLSIVHAAPLPDALLGSEQA